MDQPHILVTGDAWQYVPFGRARLKSLRATGLSYASQSYTVDGTTIKVRIVGDQSFIQIDGEQTLYCESGQLFWPFRPRYSPLWGEAATWAFMDIPTTGKYLGKVKTGKEGRGDQVNTPKLSEGMRSKAIGWPLADLGSVPANETKDKETQEKYFTHTITKKRAMGLLPASIFSGKMRLFMQSLYGAKEPNPDNPGDYFPFLLDNEDEPPLVMLRSSLEGGSMLMIRSDSMGIFTAPDDTYWLLDINEGPRNVLVNKINTSKAKSLVKQLKDMSADERAKAEAYIFANSKIEIPKSEDTVYATGTFPEVVGSAMAYGWKWSESGSKASIVVHEQLGETIPETRWHARTVHLTFTYSEGSISVSGTVEDHNDWIDGWGEYNIFVPGIPPVLDLYTLRAGSGMIPPLIPFPPTPIYGWYRGEAWTPLVLSNNSVQSVTVDSESGGVTYPNGGSCPPHTQTPGVGGGADGGAAYTTHYVVTNHNPGRVITFGGVTVVGGARNIDDRVVMAEVSGNLGLVGAITERFVTTPPGFPLSSGDTLILTGQNAGHTVYSHSIMQTATIISTQTNGDIYTRYVIVIPHGDCEALYIPKSVTSSAGSVTTTEVGNTSFQFRAFWINRTPDPDIEMPLGDGGSWVSIPYSIVSGDWVDVDGAAHTGFHTYTETSTPPPDGTVDVICFTKDAFGFDGEPGGSYNGLFDCAYYYPQYDRGMYTYASYGGRYILSEGLPNPRSITWHNFVGWA